MLRATYLCIQWYVAIYFSCWPSFIVLQTWLDERLFGWSKSASRGTSAWAGTSSHEISRAATPDISDEEDGPGDYDNLLGVLDSKKNTSHSRARSARSSYADIQKLRRTSNAPLPANFPVMTSATEPQFEPNPSLDSDGLHMRHGHRTRRASLSDGVPVERISVLDRQEPFEEATREINQEISERKASANHSHQE